MEGRGKLATTAQPKVIKLWPDGAPGSESWTQREKVMDGSKQWSSSVVIRNVSQPTITAYLPEPAIATGTAVVVCPGGAAMFLCWDKEGTDIAQWLTARGIAAFVLKYRLMKTPTDDEEFVRYAQEAMAARHAAQAEERKQVGVLAVEDGRQAIRIVRRRAGEWGIRPDRIGIMGFSAGGMVTSGVALQHDAESRPDFVAPIYGAPREAVTVPADAAPLFIAVAADDQFGSAASVHLYSAWRESGHPAELHVYSTGGHGFGLLESGLPARGWIDRFAEWLKAEGLLP